MNNTPKNKLGNPTLNGCDADDPAYTGLQFQISNGTGTGILVGNTSGNFDLPLGVGTFTIVPVADNPTYYEISPDVLEVTMSEAPETANQHFCVVPNGIHHDLEVVFVPAFMLYPNLLYTRIVIRPSGCISL